MSNKTLSLVTCIFLFALIIFLSLALSFAWFSFSDSVDAHSLPVSLNSGQRFEFASKGNASFYYEIEEELGYRAGIETVIDDETFYSSGNNGTVRFMVKADSSFDNLPEATKQKLYPGDHGKITFYLLMSDGEATTNETARLGISTICYKEAEEAEPNHTVERISVEFFEDLIKGHILFFRNYDEESGFYSEWINDSDDFTVEFEAGDRYKEVTLYWVWPTYFEQLVEHSADRKSICINDSADMNRLRQDIMDYPEQYLSLGGGRFDGTVTDFDRINEFHNFYNAADETIGSEIDFLLFEFRVNGGN